MSQALRVICQWGCGSFSGWWRLRDVSVLFSAPIDSRGYWIAATAPKYVLALMVALFSTVNNICWRSSRSLAKRARLDNADSVLCSSAGLWVFHHLQSFSHAIQWKSARRCPHIATAFNCSWKENPMGLGTIRKRQPKKKAPSRCLLRRMQSSSLKKEGNGKPVVGSPGCIAHYSVLHVIFQSYSASLVRSRWGRTRNSPSPRYWFSFSLPNHKSSSVWLSNLLAFPPSTQLSSSDDLKCGGC